MNMKYLIVLSAILCTSFGLQFNAYGVIPNDVYHSSHVTYRRNLNLPLDNEQDIVPPVYVRHIPSPVKNEPIVPIIDVAAPLIAQHHAPVVTQHHAPAVTQHHAPARRSYYVPQTQAPVVIHHEEIRAPEIHYEPQPQPQVFIQEAEPQIVRRNEEPKVIYYQRGQHHLLGADVPLTHDGLTYEVARARDQHFAAIAAVKATLPPLRQ